VNNLLADCGKQDETQDMKPYQFQFSSHQPLQDLTQVLVQQRMLLQWQDHHNQWHCRKNFMKHTNLVISFMSERNHWARARNLWKQYITFQKIKLKIICLQWKEFMIVINAVKRKDCLHYLSSCASSHRSGNKKVVFSVSKPIIYITTWWHKSPTKW
jgi:hypothetical protein